MDQLGQLSWHYNCDIKAGGSPKHKCVLVLGTELENGRLNSACMVVWPVVTSSRIAGIIMLGSHAHTCSDPVIVTMHEHNVKRVSVGLLGVIQSDSPIAWHSVVARPLAPFLGESGS